MYDDFWPSFPSESANADLPSVAPPPLESFEEVLKALEHENFDGGFQLPTLLDIPSPPYRDASTLYLAPSFESTYSTPGLTEDISNTEYSFITHPTSNYPSLFDLAVRDIVLGSEDNHVDPKYNHVISPSMFPEESGTPQLFFQRDHVVNSQLDDDGPDRQLVGISPHRLSAASPGPPPPPAVPIDPPTDAASATRVFTGPIRKKPSYYQCDQCGRGKYNLYFIYFRDTQCFFLVIKRKSNMTAHMKTHDPNRERPFVCPESDCRYRTDRSHDLTRHLEDIHGVQAE
jgi:hypothetical protein